MHSILHLLTLTFTLTLTLTFSTTTFAIPFHSSSSSSSFNNLHLHLHNHNHKSPQPHTLQSRAPHPNPVQQLLQIAPTSNTCTGATFPTECTTSSISVVQAMVDSFAHYNITTATEQAALLSWMAFESGEFKYNRNHFPAPGRPGQGTRVMLMPNFVQEYADSIPALKAKVAAIGGGGSGGGVSADPDAVLALVMEDKYSFGAAAWYYSVHCSAEQKKAVKAGGRQAWETAFVTGCVGTTVTDERVLYWTRASLALGVSTT